VVEAGRRLGLAQESLLGLGVPVDFMGQELEGDRPAKLRVLGFINDAHAALAGRAQDLVAAADDASGLTGAGRRRYRPGLEGPLAVRGAPDPRPAPGAEPAVGGDFGPAVGAFQRATLSTFDVT